MTRGLQIEDIANVRLINESNEKKEKGKENKESRKRKLSEKEKRNEVRKGKEKINTRSSMSGLGQFSMMYFLTGESTKVTLNAL